MSDFTVYSEGRPLSRTAALRRKAARETWWQPISKDWPYPLSVGFLHEATDAEWLAQAFRLAVAKVHEYGVKEGPDPLSELVRRGAAERPDDEVSKRALAQIVPHLNVEDDDYNCPHVWCQRYWPMVRAAEARARLDSESSR